MTGDCTLNTPELFAHPHSARALREAQSGAREVCQQVIGRIGHDRVQAARRLPCEPVVAIGMQQAGAAEAVRGVLPLGQGVLLDPFAGSGSTLAAANAVGYPSIGVERDLAYFNLACEAIPRLSALNVADSAGERLASQAP